MTRDETLARIAELDREIDTATGWGAGLAALCEWRDGLAQSVGMTPRRMVGGVPVAD